MSRAKHWCFTLNNHTEEEILFLRANVPQFTYLVFGREQGDSGTPHLQGYLSYDTRRGLAHVKATVGARAHCEIARGTPKQASEYCKKDGDFEEFGQIQPGAGSRSDLISLYGDIRGGACETEIEEAYPACFIRYQRSIQSLLRKYDKPRVEPPTIYVYWGATGTGKTRTVYESHSLEEIYTHPGGMWFDGYHGQPVALFDDFGGSEFKLTYLLKLLDRYPMRVPIKGSFVNWRPTTIYLTSNLSPESWFPNAHPPHVQAMLRRFTEIKIFGGNPFDP